MPTSLPSVSRREILLLFLIGALYTLLWIAAQANRDLDTQDLFWYLNRAQLWYRGDLTDPKFYNIGYPLLVGLFNIVIGHTMIAAVVFHTLVGGWLFTVLYWLAVTCFNRQIAWTVLILLGTHIYFLSYLRQMQTMILFSALILSNLALLLLFLRHPSWRGALAMGILTALSIFVRIESVYYGIFLLAGCLIHARRTQQFRQSALWFFSSVVFIGVTFFTSLWIINSVEQGGREDLFINMAAAPDMLGYLYTEFRGDAHLILSFWSPLLWLALCIAWIRRIPYKRGALLFLALLLFHVSFLFITTQTTIVGSSLYFLIVCIYSAFLIAWGIWSLAGWVRRPWLGWLIVAAVAVTNLAMTLPKEQLAAPFTFMVDVYAQDAVLVDEWLRENELSETKIYTLCYHLIGYSSAEWHYLYRYGTTGDLPGQWDAPENLMPRLIEENALLMSCNDVMLTEWRLFLNGNTRFPPYELVAIETVKDKYTFYRAVRSEPVTP